VSANDLSPTVGLAADQARDLILSSASKGDRRLPGERALAASIGVSRTTIRAALRHLASEGLIEGHPQRGWFVRSQTQLSDRPGHLESFSEIALARGFTPSSVVLGNTVRRATLDEAEQLGLPPASHVIELERVRQVNDTAVCLDRSLLPEQLCEAVLEADLTSEGLFDALERRCGLTLHRSSCVIHARGADRREGRLLGLSAGEPVLEMSSISYSTLGVVVLVSDLVYRADSYRFQADIYRRTP